MLFRSACWLSGPPRAGIGRAGGAWARGALQVLDRVSAGSSPANAGRGRGQEQGGRLGVLLGNKCKLQDMVVQWLAADWPSGHGGGHAHAMAA